MVLKLDPRAAVVWRDPFSLQFGIDPVRVVLREVTNAEERMIASLSAGISASGLTMIARASGAGESDVTGLLARLEPLLLPTQDALPAQRVSIVGSGPTVDRIAGLLAANGVQVVLGTSVPDAPCDVGLAVGHYVLDPDSYGFWLRRDLPHLAVTFGDQAATIGPLVEPGVTACLYCLEHYRRDADASWAAIASQLWGRRSSTETPLVSTEVATRVVRIVLDRLAGRMPDVATSIALDAAGGGATIRTWLPHPDCGCIGLPNDVSSSAGRRESGSAPDLDRPMTTGGVVALV